MTPVLNQGAFQGHVTPELITLISLVSGLQCLK